MEALTSLWANGLSGLIFASLPSSLGTEVCHSTTPISPTSSVYFIREDSSKPRTHVNIFDDKGNKVFILERLSAISPFWRMFAGPEYNIVAIIRIGLLNRMITEFGGHSKVQMHFNTGIRGKLHRHFYDHCGNLFSWNRRSKHLERISNPGGGHSEHRTVVSSAKPLRLNHLDWEILVDTTKIEIVTAIASAFVTMRTQWIISHRVIPGHHVNTPILSLPLEQTSSEAKPGKFESNNVDQLMVFNPPPVSKFPRDFFNPPEFMKHLYQ